MTARESLDAQLRLAEEVVRARMGEGSDAVSLVRMALATALDNGLTGAAAEIYQRLADSLEHAGEYAARAAKVSLWIVRS